MKLARNKPEMFVLEIERTDREKRKHLGFHVYIIKCLNRTLPYLIILFLLQMKIRWICTMLIFSKILNDIPGTKETQVRYSKKPNLLAGPSFGSTASIKTLFKN